VPRESVREELVIEDVDARRVVIERRGLCTLEELVAVSSAQHAFPDAADAIGLLLRSVALARGAFSPACVEVDERGDVAVFRAGVPAGPNAARLVSMLAHLLCRPRRLRARGRRVDAVSPRTAVERLFRSGPEWTPREFCARLAELEVPLPSLSSIGATVRRLFPERAAAEATSTNRSPRSTTRAIAALAEIAT